MYCDIILYRRARNCWVRHRRMEKKKKKPKRQLWKRSIHRDLHQESKRVYYTAHKHRSNVPSRYTSLYSLRVHPPATPAAHARSPRLGEKIISL